MNENSFVRESLGYLRLGWGILPIKSGEKHPPIAWSEWKTRLASEEEVFLWGRLYPGCGVGIVTGKVSGLLVVDADGEEGIESLKKLDLIENQSPVVKTPSGGRHIYFQHPGFHVMNHVKTIPGFPGFDIRSDNGLVVAPCSAKPEYRWLVGPEVKPSKIPENFLGVLKDGEANHSSLPRQSRKKFNFNGTVPEGQRHEFIFTLASGFSRSSRTYEHHRKRVFALHAKYCPIPLPDHELERIVRRTWDLGNNRNTYH